MAKIFSTQLSIVEETENLSSEYYTSEIMENILILKKYNKINNYFVLNDKKYIKKIETRTFHTYSSKFYTNKKNKGLPLIHVKSLNEIFIKVETYILKTLEERFNYKFVFPTRSVFISRGGTLGLVGINYEDLGDCSISQDVIGIQTDEEKIKPEVLLIFFLSKFGQSLLKSCVIGGVQPHIELSKLKRKSIPSFSKKFQTYIEQLVKQAYEKRKLAEQKYQQAEELLYKLLEITQEEIEKLEEKKAYQTNFKNVSESLRFDAEYYYPKYLDIIELLKKISFEIKPLNKVVEISDEKIDPTKGENKTKRFRYVPIAKINESGEIFEWDEFYGWQAPSRARMLIKENDILIPSLAGTFDKIALVPRELDKQLTTTGCFVVRVKEDYPEFLFLLLRTPLFKRQLEQQTTGAIMSAVPKSVFGDLLIPKIPKGKQKEIATLVREYFELRKEMRELIKQAIKKVEEEIEHASITGAVRE